MQMKMNMENCWNDNDKGKPKYSERNLFQSQLVHHKSHMNWPEIEHGHQQSEDPRLTARPKG
jgi:hypothetical protein